MTVRSIHLFALFGINPASWVTSFVKAMFKDALGAIGTAASDVLGALIGFMNATTEPVFSSGWWTTSGAQVFERVLAVAGSLMFIGFAMSVVSSILSHDHTVMAKAALHLPLAVIEMAALVTVTAALISGSDELSTYIAGGGSRGLTAFVTTTLAVAVTTGGIVGILLAGFIIVAGLLVWAVLIVRTALIYVAVMTGPLIFASSIHPATRHVHKRYIEGGLALICSKIIMAIAFATGSAMLGGIDASASFADAIGALMQALAILLIAAFAPFIFVKLLLAAEALTIAEGIERRPLRSGMSGASGVYHAAGLQHLMGRVGGASSGGAAGGEGEDPGGGSGGGPSGGASSGGSSGRAGGVARGVAAARRVASHVGSSGETSAQGSANDSVSGSAHTGASPTGAPPASAALDAEEPTSTSRRPSGTDLAQEGEAVGPAVGTLASGARVDAGASGGLSAAAASQPGAASHAGAETAPSRTPGQSSSPEASQGQPAGTEPSAAGEPAATSTAISAGASGSSGRSAEQLTHSTPPGPSSPEGPSQPAASSPLGDRAAPAPTGTPRPTRAPQPTRPAPPRTPGVEASPEMVGNTPEGGTVTDLTVRRALRRTPVPNAPTSEGGR